MTKHVHAFTAATALLPAACTANTMEKTPMPAEQNRAALARYLESNHSDLSMMAEDVIFTNMATGDEHNGREAVRQMLDFVYHGAFEGHAETRNLIVDGDRAVLEATFVGTHKGEFAGVAATGREVRVPLAVIYDMKDGMITRGRIYFEVPAFLAQVREQVAAGKP
ncbi:MAG TPA: ester cyclase [Gemmatimonadales bacterium]|nr:ester cyclase [Gemmatimonadales bacterium]